MVVGDTGVGKSMFLEIFEKLYRERKKPSDIESKEEIKTSEERGM